MLRFVLNPVDSYRFYLGSAFFYAFCWSTMTIVSLVYMVQVAHLDPLQMVLVGTLLELSVFIFEIPTGIVADLHSRRLSVVIGYLMLGSGFMLLGLYPRFDVILLSQVIWGIGSTFISGARQAWLSDEIGSEKANRTFLVSAQFSQIGYLLGIPFSIWLAHKSLSLPIVVGSAGVIVLGLFAGGLMGEKDFHKLDDEHRMTWSRMTLTFSTGIERIRARPLLVLILLIALVGGVYSEGFDRLNVPFLIEHFAFPQLAGLDTVVWWGLLAAGSTLLSVVATGYVRKHVDTENSRQIILLLSVLTGGLSLLMVIFALSQWFTLAVLSYFGIAVIRAVSGPLTTAWMNQNLESSTRATLFSMHAQADAFGQVAGGPVVGAVGKFYSLRYALLLSGVLLSPSIAFYRRAFRLKTG